MREVLAGPQGRGSSPGDLPGQRAASRRPDESVSARLRSAAAEAGKIAFGNQAAFADWAGTHRSQITRLSRGQDVGGEPGWRIAGLASVVLALLEVYERDAVPGWLRGINPHLNNRRPLDVLATGDAASVMSSIQAVRVGSFA